MAGDRGPLPCDATRAGKTRFGTSIVPGGGTRGILSAMVAEDPPGPGTVLPGVEGKFVKAAGVGKAIAGRVDATALRDDKPICSCATALRDAAGERGLTGGASGRTMRLNGAAERASTRRHPPSRDSF